MQSSRLEVPRCRKGRKRILGLVAKLARCWLPAEMERGAGSHRLESPKSLG